MIDPKSLRIGSYIHSNGQTIVVTEIRSNELQELGYKGSISADVLDDPYRTHVAPWLAKCSGIPLSEQELIRLGFEKEELEDDSERNIYQRPTMSSTGRKIPFVIEQCLNGYYSPVMYNDIHEEIKYVHQLQNLYYPLTGSELTYES